MRARAFLGWNQLCLHSPATWRGAQSSTCARLGCPHAHCTHDLLAADLNRRISPLFHADKICKPLLIGQGSNDPRVKQAEADQIFEAMKVRHSPSVVYAVCCRLWQHVVHGTVISLPGKWAISDPAFGPCLDHRALSILYTFWGCVMAK